MKTVLFTHEYAPFRGGAATYVQEIAAAASAQNYPVEVWAADYRGRALPDATLASAAEKFHVERFPSSGRLTPAGLAGLVWGLWKLRKQPGRLRESRVVLLSAGAQMAWMLLWVIGVLPARGVTCFFHGSELLRFSRQAAWRRLAEQFFARVDGFAVASHYVEKLARESGLLPAQARICLAPCACPAPLMDGAEAAIKAAGSAPDDPWRVLTVARLHPRKGQVELAESMALLPPGVRERVVYQMVGTGTADYRRRIEAACRAGGIRHEFLGGVPGERLGALYAGCTLYAQASRTLPRSVEGFGISFLEASLHGKAVAAYVTGGVAEAVLDGETGLLVPEGDSAGLASAIQRLLVDSSLRERLGAGGRRHAAGFDWKRSARALCDFASRDPGAPGLACDAPSGPRACLLGMIERSSRRNSASK